MESIEELKFYRTYLFKPNVVINSREYALTD